ncbi:MAG: cysteine desulfurase [Clostridiales bacterium]|nr:cysteine desulfurase [Clostridiales bacterium]
MIYLDNAATMRVFDCAICAAENVMRNEYFNPNATYKSGVAAHEKIEAARRVIASAMGVFPDELVFTSCATEANNWVFNSGIKNKKGNIVISAGEHSSVYEPAMQLKSKGADVRIAPLRKDGTVDEKALYGIIDNNTALVSVIHVSNETGVINPIKSISENIKKLAPRALIHSDGVQGFLKTNDTVSSLGVDFYSASAHKIGAPKGIGLLFIKRELNIAPLIYGGGQERGLRSGTQNTPYIEAFASAVQEFSRLCESSNIQSIRNELCECFTAQGYRIIGNGNNSGYILCVCVPGVKAEILQNIAHDDGVIIGKGAACSGTKRGNRVLSAVGLDQKSIESCIRISFAVDTSKSDVNNAAKIIIQAAERIRSEHVG